ncbi:nitroreductase family protein [Microbacter margulisiae]|uniref:Nitroreductase n=1 Tax=Microbacter margulisiae TaxID=1350067 RepID=A0A7W5H1K7_9PORP|nr:nitroreductase family protein [Microbacter margulisiae]MBB3186724.1 nitroreductase [Microbacter margulisiae]
MNFLELASKRTSVRKFQQKLVEQEKLDYILQAMQIAPTAVNFQPLKFIVLQGKKLQEIQPCYPRNWFETAPLCIVACGDHNRSWKRSSDEKDYCDIDVAIATTHLMLAATEQGLGTCWISNFDAKQCKIILSLPKNIEPLALIPIGYSDEKEEDLDEKVRKPLSELVEYR